MVAAGRAVVYVTVDGVTGVGRQEQALERRARRGGAVALR